MRRGFTLIELLVVIAIVGILATLTTMALMGIKAKARDSKRISDIRQMQSALEMYRNDADGYPSAVTGSQPLSYNGQTYLRQVPLAPNVVEGACSSDSYVYSSANSTSYSISYCLSGKVESAGPGVCLAVPGDICRSCTSNCSATCAGSPDPVCGVACPSSPSVPAVTGFTAVADGAKTTVALNWNPISITGVNYKLQYSQSTNGGSTWSPYADVSGATNLNVTNFNHTPLNANYLYRYTIEPTACSLTGALATSSETGCTDVAVAPSGLTLTPASAQITATWNAVTGATSYTLYGNGNNSNTALYTGSDLTYLNNSPALTNGTTYYYTVSSTVCGIASAKSAQVSAVPAVPTICTAPSRAIECNISTNSKGNFCGGGSLYCEGEANCGAANLVASPPFNSSAVCATTDGLTRQWKNAGTANVSPYLANDVNIGYNNINGNASPTEASYNPGAAGAGVYPAAQFCADLVVDTFDDWYLPSKNELNGLILSGNTLGALNGCTPSTPCVFGLNTGGTYYWSSTEFDSGLNAWVQNSAGVGTQSNSGKTSGWYFRCVRRF